jgi:hypothetical protein
MPARVLLDVDLEDKLLYGLTPMRLAYVVVALLAGFALWSEPWAPTPVRAGACLAVIGLGAVLAWARWRGKPTDRWLTDLSIFVISSYRVRWDRHWLHGLWQRRPLRKRHLQPARPLMALETNRQADGEGAASEVLVSAEWRLSRETSVRR